MQSTISSLAEVILVDGRNINRLANFTLPALYTPAGEAVSQTYSYTGLDQTFQVPANVTSMSITMKGAGGQTYASGNNGSIGGQGGLVSGTLAVTPGETLTLIVGGYVDIGTGRSYGGGGVPGSGRFSGRNGGIGGGRSAIRRGTTELATAGGGGGSGYGSSKGGSGGGSTGGDGVAGPGYGEPWGLGGTQTAGGTGSDGSTARQGSQFTGGDADNEKNYAGGGGAGWYGGGAGSGGGTGGGGSSYIDNLTGSVVNMQGEGALANTAGSIDISYSVTVYGENSLILTPGQGIKMTIKDPYGTFASVPMRISTMFTDRFENGLSEMVISTNFASLQLYGASNRWYAIQSNTSGGFSQSTFAMNCNAPRYVFDVNTVANVSTINFANIQNQAPIPYSQSNLFMTSADYTTTTNLIHFNTPTTTTINNTLFIDGANRLVGIRTGTPNSAFALDINGRFRGSVYYSSITSARTITPNTDFGVYYNISASGSYTLALSNRQPLSNIGKFYVLRNNSGGSLSITITGGAGIASPYTLLNQTSIAVTVNSGNSYTVF